MKKLLLFLFVAAIFQTRGQEDAWIFLKDKPNKALIETNEEIKNDIENIKIKITNL